MKTIHSVIIKVDSEVNDLINIKSENGKVMEILLDTSFKPMHHARICGEVVNAPIKIFRQRLYEIYPGSPKPTPFRSGETVARIMSSTKITEYDKDIYSDLYDPSGYEPEACVSKDPMGTIIEGDRVWFHYLQLSQPENYVGKSADGLKLYKIDYEQIFCIVRKGEIIMVNNTVLVQPYVEKGFVKGSDGVWAKFQGNIIAEINPKPQYLKGVVKHINEGHGIYARNTVQKEDVILFTPKSEFENEIEGETYYKMLHNDIIAVVDGDKINVVGDFCLIKPEYDLKNKIIYDEKAKDQEFKPGQIFILEDSIKKDTEFAEVLGCGELCEEDLVGKKVIFDKKKVVHIDDKLKFIRYSDIMAVKSV